MDFRGTVLLAPLTKGGNLPFRRLCRDFGARITMSEMAYARQVVRGSRSELALLRKHPDEELFGVQLAARQPQEAVQAARIAIDRGASFIDINAGCPIHDVVRRGMGATLLQRPRKLGKLVEALAQELEVPVTVKIRSGWNERERNALEVAHIAEEAGAAALTVHGRTREQRYTRAADWDIVALVAAAVTIPVIGNGDLLTWFEVADRWQAAGCAGVMLARGVLIKPWLFREVAEQREWLPTAEERVAVYFRFASYLKEHFRDDEQGRERAMRFLPWHLGFFCRYRPLPAETFRAASREHPLLQSRLLEDGAAELPLLEQMLRDPREDMHKRIAAVLWGSGGAEEAVAGCLELAEECPPQVAEAPAVRVAQG